MVSRADLTEQKRMYMLYVYTFCNKRGRYDYSASF